MQRDIVRRGKLSFFGSVSGKATAGERQHREIWMSIARARCGRRGQRRGGDRHPIVPDLRRVRLLAGAAGRRFRRTACSRARARSSLQCWFFWGTGARAQLSGRRAPSGNPSPMAAGFVRAAVHI